MGEHIEFILIAVAVLLALLFVKKSLVIIPQSETKKKYTIKQYLTKIKP